MQEDFLTELISDVFQNADMVKRFFETFAGASLSFVGDVSVSTQQAFPKILDHDTESIPDITLRFTDGSVQHIAFFENKVDAVEGKDQLRRYADHLRTYQDSGYTTWLFYVTRRDDPKSMAKIFKNGVSAKFVPLRWYRVYDWLNSFREDSYIKNVVQYTEEIQLNDTRRFVPQDMYALQQMNRLQRMMDNCLDGAVDSRMKELFGRNISWSNRTTQLRHHSRYVKANEQVEKNPGQFWIACGFEFTTDDYPIVTSWIEVSPTAPDRQIILDAMKIFLETNSDWHGANLDEKSAWSNIRIDVSLLDFLKTDDHVEAIQTFFLEKLNVLSSFKQGNPSLPWKQP